MALYGPSSKGGLSGREEEIARCSISILAYPDHDRQAIPKFRMYLSIVQHAVQYRILGSGGVEGYDRRMKKKKREVRST